MRGLLLFFSWAFAAQAADFDIRPTPNSRFALDVYKSKLWEGRKHTFVFDQFEGLLNFDAESPEKSTVRFVVKSASARCVDDWVKPNQIKDIERAAVMETMAADEYPEITFQSTKVTRTSSEHYDVQGILTIRGRAKPVTITLNTTPREGGIGVQGSSRIRLSEFGLKPPRGIIGVTVIIGTKDEMSVVFDLFAHSR